MSSQYLFGDRSESTSIIRLSGMLDACIARRRGGLVMNRLGARLAECCYKEKQVLAITATNSQVYSSFLRVRSRKAVAYASVSRELSGGISMFIYLNKAVSGNAPWAKKFLVFPIST